MIPYFQKSGGTIGRVSFKTEEKLNRVGGGD